LRTALSLPLRLLRARPSLLASFAAASLGRAALTAAALLLIREFLGGVLHQHGWLAGWAAHTFGAGATLWVLGALLVSMQLGASFLGYFAQLTQQRILSAIELGVMELLVGKVFALSIGFFDRRTHGEVIQAIRQDVAQMRSVTLAAAQGAVDLVQAVGLVATAVVLSPTLAFWAFLVLPLAVGPVVLLAQRALTRSRGVRRRGVALYDILLQLAEGMRIIKVYGSEEAEAARTLERARLYFGEVVEMERVRSLARVTIEALAGLSLTAVVVAGGFQVLNGAMGWPELLAFMMAARAAQGPLGSVCAGFVEIQRNAASVEQLDALLRERPRVHDRADARPLAGQPGLLAARGVSFSLDGVPVLRDVSFEVRRGELLGVVGPSGAGKSTLLGLVARFFDPVAGVLLLDGDDLRTLRTRDVHACTALVTQEPFLFNTSVRVNIRCGRPAATDAEVEAAARAAEIHDFIAALPRGYETVVGHGGRPLSRGEAQRVNVARAILKDAPILLLDEVTSSMDPVAEAAVQRAIDRLIPGRLTIVVAHRLSTLRNAARILVLDEGRVVGLGTYAELLECCPAFRRMDEAQAEPVVAE